MGKRKIVVAAKPTPGSVTKAKERTTSAVNSPLVSEKNRQTLMTPSQKRPSTEMTPKLTDAKKRKIIVAAKSTPGSVTKAKERTTSAVNSPLVSEKNRQTLMTPSQKRPSTE